MYDGSDDTGNMCKTIPLFAEMIKELHNQMVEIEDGGEKYRIKCKIVGDMKWLAGVTGGYQSIYTDLFLFIIRPIIQIV